MKNLCLTFQKTFSLPGYEVIRIYGDDLLGAIPATVGEVDDLLVLDVVDYLPQKELDPFLDKACHLLAVNGTITVSSNDIVQISTKVVKNLISPLHASILLYGDSDMPRRGCYGVGLLTAALEGRGLKVISKKLEYEQAIVVAKRM